MVEEEEYDCVGQYDLINGETQELLTDGQYLRDGMEIVFPVTYRYPDENNDIVDDRGEKWFQWFLHNNWMKISQILVMENFVYFIATFNNGHQERMSVNVNQPWVVRKETRPIEPSHTLVRVVELSSLEMIADNSMHIYGKDKDGNITELVYDRNLNY